MWIKNKKTGLVWEVIEKSQIARLLKNADYVESRKAEAKKKADPKEV